MWCANQAKWNFKLAIVVLSNSYLIISEHPLALSMLPAGPWSPGRTAIRQHEITQNSLYICKIYSATLNGLRLHIFFRPSEQSPDIICANQCISNKPVNIRKGVVEENRKNPRMADHDTRIVFKITNMKNVLKHNKWYQRSLIYIQSLYFIIK